LANLGGPWRTLAEGWGVRIQALHDQKNWI